MPILDNTTIAPPFANLAAIKAWDTTASSDSCVANVKTLGFYRFDSSSSATPDDDYIIQPTTGGGRWIKLTSTTADVAGVYNPVTTSVTLPTPLPHTVFINAIDGSQTLKFPALTTANGAHVGDVINLINLGSFQIALAYSDNTIVPGSVVNAGNVKQYTVLTNGTPGELKEMAVFGTLRASDIPLDVNSGGTGATTQSAARTNLGLGTIATQNANNVDTDVIVSTTTSGATRTLTCQNTSNTTNSAALVKISTAGNLAGDPALQLTTTSTSWTVGCDNSVDDNFTISRGTALGTNDVMRVTQSGEITYPKQPLFLAYKSSSTTNFAGDGGIYDIVCDTEVKDQGSVYNNSTGVFTAPVTGTYEFNFGVVNINAGGFQALSNIQLVATSITMASYLVQPVTGVYVCQGSTLIDMTAGQTAQLKENLTDVNGKTVTLYGDANLNTFFCGWLVA